MRTRRQLPGEVFAFTEKAANGVSTAFCVSDWKHVNIDVFCSNTVNAKLKVYKSNQDEKPDFSAAVSLTNRYSTVEIIDLEDEGVIKGDDSLTLNADGDRNYKLNDDYSRWIGFEVTNYSAGKITVAITACDNA